MTFDYTKAFETPNGFVVEGASGVFSGASSPVGIQAPVGSLYLRTNNELWRKNGAGANDWDISLNASGITNYTYSTEVPFSTTSTSYTPVTDYSVTPISGTYAVWVNGSWKVSNSSASMSVGIFSAGSIHPDSKRIVHSYGSSKEGIMATMTNARVNGSEAIDVRVSTTAGTLTVKERSIILIRLGS